MKKLRNRQGAPRPLLKKYTPAYALGVLTLFISEHISGMKLIQLFAREREKAAEFEERAGSLYRAQMRELLTFAVFRPGISLLANTALALILYRGGVGVLTGTVTLGTLYNLHKLHPLVL